MGIRKVASAIVVAAFVLVGTTGCNFFVPQATLTSYDPSDGVRVHSGEASIDNALWITEDGENAQFIGRLTNRSTEDLAVNIEIQLEGGDTTQALPITVPANSTLDFGATPETTLVVDNLGSQPGSTIGIYLQAGEAEGASTLVPVLNGDLAEYATLVPTPASSPASE